MDDTPKAEDGKLPSGVDGGVVLVTPIVLARVLDVVVVNAEDNWSPR